MLHFKLKSIVNTVIATTFLCFGGKYTYAQTPVPASDPERVLAATVVPNVPLSTAMVESPALGTTLSAIAGGDATGVWLHLELGDGVDIHPIIPIGSGTNHWSTPDVAIVDEPGSGGLLYHVAVTYRVYLPLSIPAPSYDLMVEEFTVDLSSGSILVTSGSGPILINAAPVVGNPTLRIDAAVDENTVGAGIPEMNRFVILHTEGGNYVHVRDKDLNPITFTPLPLYQAVASSWSLVATDVSANIDYSSGSPELMAQISFLDGFVSTGGTDLYVASHRFSTGATSVPSLLMSGLYLYNPRIEAFGIYDPVSFGSAKWMIAVDSMNTIVKVFTDLTPGGHTVNPTLTSIKAEYPTVAAGIGAHPSVPLHIGSTQYSFAWGGPLGSDYYANALDQMGVPISPTTCSVVNTNPCTLMSDPPDLISMSHSCNTGLGTVTAWNEGSRILYKIRVDDNYQFRPGTNEIREINSAEVLEIYPNPATDKVTIKNAAQGSGFLIFNQLGMLVAKGVIHSTKQSVAVNDLSAGLYQLQLKDSKGNVRSRTFTKTK